MREGGCLCGAVRYRIAGEPVSAGLCHCRSCRKIASAPVLPFATFRTDAFTWTQGTPADFQSSAPVTRSFCGRCGSPLTYRHSETPDLFDIMIGSLDDPDSVAPTFHVWTSHKIAWDPIDDGLPAFPQARESAQPSG
jgi:hypothetical protein